MIRKTACSVVALLVLIGATPAFATNGMNLEGYGSKSLAMGGTGSAYDTGNSAVMNNPATLGFMKAGTSQISIGVTGLHPDVDVIKGGIKDDSVASAFFMPSLSYMRRDGKMTWGAAMIAQGGMGTDYGNHSNLFSGLSGQDNKSQVGVARIMFPIAYHLTDQTTIGGSFDLVMASMNLQMDMDGAHLAGMMAGNGGSVSGAMRTSLDSMMGNGMITGINYARFDFSNNSPWVGKATGYGTGLKFGVTQQLSKEFTIGGSYHTKTRLTDLETSKATISFSGTGPAFGLANPISLTGKIKVHDFEWPATFAGGFAFQPNDKLMITSDVKFIQWANVMSKFSMTFVADNVALNGDFGGKELNVDMTQNWKDQTVWSVGVQYMATKTLALRAGAIFASNPVPDQYLNALFPAIEKNHYTCGFGYQLSNVSSIDAAFSFVPKVTATNGDGTVISHSQKNWALNYTHSL
jgi:long-chain fatty acid transport protein